MKLRIGDYYICELSNSCAYNYLKEIGKILDIKYTESNDKKYYTYLILKTNQGRFRKEGTIRTCIEDSRYHSGCKKINSKEQLWAELL